VDGHEADSALQLHSDQLHNHSLQPAMTVLSDVCNEHEIANCSSKDLRSLMLNAGLGLIAK
jgi:hypothetical protein